MIPAYKHKIPDPKRTEPSILPNRMKLSEYPPCSELNADERRLAMEELLPAWEASKSTVRKELASIPDVVKGIPRRTVCAEFGNENTVGPPQKQLVASWFQVVGFCEVDLNKKEPHWWTLAWHGDSPSDPEGDGLELPSLIFDESGGMSVYTPSFTPRDIDAALAFVRTGRDTVSTGAEPNRRLEVTDCEKVSLVRFLLLFRKLGPQDTLQLFSCHLGDPVTPTERQGPGPIALVKRLVALNPNVRIVVYSGEVGWKGTGGNHWGNDRTVYRSP